MGQLLRGFPNPLGPVTIDCPGPDPQSMVLHGPLTLRRIPALACLRWSPVEVYSGHPTVTPLDKTDCEIKLRRCRRDEAQTLKGGKESQLSVQEAARALGVD